MIPIAILTLEDESDRDFMLRFYESNVARMYLEASKYFPCTADAEDTVSDAVVKLVDKLELLMQLDERKRAAYAVTTVRHLALHTLQRRNRHRTVELESFDETVSVENAAMSEDALLSEQRRTHLQALFATLPAEDRLLLEERYLLRWSDAEIAVALGIQPDSVRMRVTRAKRRVVKLLTDQGFLLSDWI